MNTLANILTWFLIAIAAIMFSACVSVGPHYVPPEPEVPANWTQPVAASQDSKTATQIWWDLFTDAPMEQLITQARCANPGVNRAKARIDEAWAQRGVIRAGHFPHQDFLGEYDIGDRISAQINHGWTVDLFGGRRRQVEATERNIEAQVEGWRDSYVFFTSEVALYYVAVRVAEARIDLAKKRIKVYSGIESVTRQLEEEGFTSEVEASEAFALTKSEEAALPRLERDAAMAKLALARICAQSPAEIEQVVNSKSSGIPTPPACISAPFPAQLLRNRPDIRRAERKIAQQVSNVGVATAIFYPEFTLRGAITYEKLLREGAEQIMRQTIGGGGSVAQRLIHSGWADRHRLKEQEAGLEIVVRDYEEQVLLALQEVETALVSIHYAKKEIAKLEQAVSSLNRSADAMLQGYSDGLIANTDLLRIQQERFDNTERLLFAKNLLAQSAVILYESSGGGVIPLPPKDSAPMPNVTRIEGNGPLSTIFSLGKDQNKTLHRKPRNKIGRKWEMSKDQGIQPAEEDEDWRMTSDGLRPRSE